MVFITWLINGCISVSNFFWHIYLEVKDWIFPFHYIAAPFELTANAFMGLAEAFVYMSYWVDDVASKVSNILSFENIASYFSAIFDAALTASNWIANWWSNVTQVIGDWWKITEAVVLSWIDITKEWASMLISQVNTWLGSLQEAWSNFTKSILPTLASWTGVSGLINSTLIEWFPFYKTLWEIWEEIVKFFADPMQYVWDRIEEFFDRFWE